MESAPQQQLNQQPLSPHLASTTTTPTLTATMLSSRTLSPSTPPSLAPLSVPSSPLSLAAATTPSSSSSSSSFRSLSPTMAVSAPLFKQEGVGEGQAGEATAKRWEASVNDEDDESLRITLRTAKSRSTPAKRPPPTPTGSDSSSDSEPEPLMNASQHSQPSTSPTSISSSTSTPTSTSTSPTKHSNKHTAASSTRRLPWTATELSALIQGVTKCGKDWCAIMRDDKFGRLLRRRTVVACRKQFMFGRAMGQWRRGARQLPDIDGPGQAEEKEAGTERQQGQEEEGDEDEKSEAEAEKKEAKENTGQLGVEQDSTTSQQHVHVTRARTRGATAQPKEEQKTNSTQFSSDDNSQDESEDDVDMTSDTDTTAKPTRSQPWSNVRADELPPGKRVSEYRRCRHTCGCKGRKSDDHRAVVNKHGRRNHEKSESQHPNCGRHYACQKLFGNLKQTGEEEPQQDEDDDEGEEEEEESERSEDEDEEEEEEKRGHVAGVIGATAMEEDDGLRPMFGPAVPLPAAPRLYRPSSILAQSRTASSTPIHPPALYTTTTAPAGTRMAAIQSLLDLGPSASQQRQVSAARLTEWTRWKDESERFEDMIRTLRLQVAELTERERGWQRKEEGWVKDRQMLKAKIKELEAKVEQLKRSAAAKGGRNSRADTDIPVAAHTAPPSPMLMHTYPAIPIQAASPGQARDTTRQLYHSPSSAFAAVGSAQQATGSPQLPPARPLGPPYWPQASLPSTQLFPQALYPLTGLWGGPPYPPPHIPFRVTQQHQLQPHSPMYSSAANGVPGQGFPSPMTTLSLAAQPAQPTAQPSPVTLAPLQPSGTEASAGTASPAMPAITLSGGARRGDDQSGGGQLTAAAANGITGNGV